MKKLATVVLIFLIIITVSYSTIRIASNSSNEANWFNKTWREKFSRVPFFRTIFLLHWDGDARANYLLSDPFTSLRIEIDKYDQCDFSENVITQVVQEIESITGKYGMVTVTESDTIPLAKGQYTSDEIRGMKQRYQDFKSGGGEVALYILCINEYEEIPTNIGHTTQEDGIVFFWYKIFKITKGKEELLDDYVSSTILHEFGHQLGIGHIESPWCLMDESIESPPTDLRLSFIPTVYCDEELKAVQKIRESLLYND